MALYRPDLLFVFDVVPIHLTRILGRQHQRLFARRTIGARVALRVPEQHTTVRAVNPVLRHRQTPASTREAMSAEMCSTPEYRSLPELPRIIGQRAKTAQACDIVRGP